MAKLNQHHKEEFVPENKRDTFRAQCVMFELSYYDEFEDKLVDGWAPPGCYRTGELAIGEETDWRWRKDAKGPVYYFCPSCEKLWQKRFGDKRDLTLLMEG